MISIIKYLFVIKGFSVSSVEIVAIKRYLQTEYKLKLIFEKD